MPEGNEFSSKIEYKGHTWEILQKEPFQLGVASEMKNDPGIEIFQTIIPQAIDKVAELLPPTQHTKKVSVALFPSSSYRANLSLSDAVPEWVKVCTRDQKTCYDVAMPHTHTWGQSLDQVPPDDRRELIHEIAHSIHPAFSDQWYHWTPLHIKEGVVEVLARILGKTQKDLPESNAYIRNHLTNDLIDPSILDTEGLFARSKLPLSVNQGYLSATSYVAGLSALLGKGNIRDGLVAIKSMAEKEQDMDKFQSQLFRHVGTPVQTPEARRKLQLAGIQELLR